MNIVKNVEKQRPFCLKNVFIMKFKLYFNKLKKVVLKHFLNKAEIYGYIILCQN